MTKDSHHQTSDIPGPQIVPRPRFPVLMVLLLIVVLVGGGTGCGLLRTTAELPGRAVNTVVPGQPTKPAADPVELQQTLLRFADQFSAQTTAGIDRLRQGTNALNPAEVLRIKLACATETASIVTGPNAFASLLDMTAFVTAMRISLEQHWQPNIYGESANMLLETCRRGETDIWGVASNALTSAQQQLLRTTIETWHKNNPQPTSILGARALELSTQFKRQEKTGADSSGNVFGLLMLDPFAGMDPAVREIAQTRLLAERALFLVGRMPTIVRWQTELLSLNATDTPTVRQLVTNSTEISDSIERFAAVAEKLPDLVSTEREEIVKALESQEQEVTGLLTNTTRASDSLNATLKTLDALMQRFGVGETNKEAATPATNAEPFRIQDYTATAAQLEATARQLTELITTLDRTLGSTNLEALTRQVAPAAEKVEASGRAVVDYAFWKGLLLILTVLLAALAYRFITGRLHRSAKN
jgi:hypothetical protein